MSNLQTWRVCEGCGREFFGYISSKFCPICKEDRKKETPPELADEKVGWRHMFRDQTGTVIVPGGNVMNALDDLCAYEEACEAAGIRGPEELRKALLERQQETGNRQQVRGGQRSGRPTKDGGTGDPSPTGGGGTGWFDPHAKRQRWTSGKHCEGCSHYHPAIHMPKQAARSFLRVTQVRREKLQAITDEEARDEGCGTRYTYYKPGVLRAAFAELWDSTVPRGRLDREGWAANPDVWEIRFEDCEKPEGWSG